MATRFDLFVSNVCICRQFKHSGPNTRIFITKFFFQYTKYVSTVDNGFIHIGNEFLNRYHQHLYFLL